MACSEWLSPNHTFFQIANMFLALTYFVPDNLKGLFILRLLLGCAGFFFALWGGYILCSPDTLGWNIVFGIINFGHVGYLLYTTRAKKFVGNCELLYVSIFEQLGVKRWQFNNIAKCCEEVILGTGEKYAEENETESEFLTILVGGSIEVKRKDETLHYLKLYEFLDSPEWMTSTQGAYAMPVTFQITLISKGSILLRWRRSTLLKLFRGNSNLRNIFELIIGQDVARKLFQIQSRRELVGSYPANKIVECSVPTTTTTEIFEEVTTTEIDKDRIVYRNIKNEDEEVLLEAKETDKLTTDSVVYSSVINVNKNENMEITGHFISSS